MDRAGLGDIEREIDAEARERFPGCAAQQVVVLQYGDDPEIEPGDLWVRVLLARTGPTTTSGRCGISSTATRRRWTSSLATWPGDSARSARSSSPAKNPSTAGPVSPLNHVQLPKPLRECHASS